MSAFESNTPRFCFNPRSIASCKESGSTPGTSFEGALPANGLTPSVPGMASPGALEPGAVWFCARETDAPHNRVPASKNVGPVPWLSLNGASLALICVSACAREVKNPAPAGPSTRPTAVSTPCNLPACQGRAKALVPEWSDVGLGFNCAAKHRTVVHRQAIHQIWYLRLKSHDEMI